MKKTVCFVLLVLALGSAFAQKEGGFKKEKLFAGGGFGLSFGRYTYVNLSPQIGYRFSRLVSAGVGLNLRYLSVKEKNLYGEDYYKTSEGITGLNLFGRFYPLKDFFVQVQPEMNYRFGSTTYYRDIYNQPTNQTFKNNAEIIPSLLAGGGYSAPAGKGRFLLMVLYDVLQRPTSPYSNKPFVSFGYNVAL